MYAPGASNLHIFIITVTLTIIEMLIIDQEYYLVISEFIVGITAVKLINIWIEKKFQMTVHITSNGISITSKISKFNFTSVKNIIIGQEEPKGRLLENIPDNLISITMVGVSSNQTIFVYDNGDSLLNTENMEN